MPLLLLLAGLACDADQILVDDPGGPTVSYTFNRLSARPSTRSTPNRGAGSQGLRRPDRDRCASDDEEEARCRYAALSHPRSLQSADGLPGDRDGASVGAMLPCNVILRAGTAALRSARSIRWRRGQHRQCRPARSRGPGERPAGSRPGDLTRLPALVPRSRKEPPRGWTEHASDSRCRELVAAPCGEDRVTNASGRPTGGASGGLPHQ